MLAHHLLIPKLFIYTYFVVLNHLYWTLYKYLPIPVAVGVCGRSHAETEGSNLAEGMDVYCERCLLLGRGLCDGPITLPEESCRLWCVIVCNLETLRMRRRWAAAP